MASDPQTARNPVRFIAHKSTTATLSNARIFSLLDTPVNISSVSSTSLPDHHQSCVMTPRPIIHLQVSEDFSSTELRQEKAYPFSNIYNSSSFYSYIIALFIQRPLRCFMGSHKNRAFRVQNSQKTSNVESIKSNQSERNRRQYLGMNMPSCR